MGFLALSGYHQGVLPEMIHGRYRLKRLIQSTPSAQVFEGVDQATGTDVAIEAGDIDRNAPPMTL